MQSIVADVPYEVWQNIASFLTSQEVKNLYAVSRPLFLIAMEERYRCVYIKNVEAAQTIRSFQRLTGKFAAQYVRELHICPFPSGEFPVAPRRRKWWERLTYTLWGSKSSSGTAQTYASERLLAILANLSSVTRYHLLCEPIGYTLNFRQFILPYILAAWSSFGSNLRHLHLSVSLEVIPNTIGTIKLDNLEELIIDIFVAYQTTNRTRIIDFSLLEFINNHCEKLTLFAMSALEPFNLDGLVLRELAPMPLLKSFAFVDTYYDLEVQNLSGLHKFLQINSQQLQKLNIEFNSFRGIFYPSPLWSTQPCFQVPLPRLKNLTIQIYKYFDDVVGGFVECVHQYTNTLTYLDLGIGFFTLGDLKELTQGFVNKSNFRKLAVHALFLSPQLLHLLSHNLAHLEDLSIKFRKVTHHENGFDVFYPSDSSQFSEEMGILSFPGTWTLRNLRLTSTSPENGDLDMIIRSAVVSAFPLVVDFNGVSRGEYMDS
ncbi:uncharacterized protein LACBIDRAFT_299710 [Laccaria bicolor S238N-H82]|uniref:Predicted protein n=1 Tax=Laccaria bicolor (strain S238N-H82 / ATCC MYA-4686) TaxID=486041 RepID=B0DF88_LACBS|nr:uncharacterized protein LACBIDRAFT_299710 [Laccaria bicolor S238N-H82]EDR06818.1 predicted protein [Laccaria bicolor S238N-H82]|eukprot:XP_001882665.1 predicted protein [Laccaria bicolor S238N-H82]